MISEDEIRWLKRKDITNGDWWVISRMTGLTEEFMDLTWDKLNKHDISGYQTLSEDFMRRHKDDLQWWAISANQNMSEEFMIEMQDYIKWETRLCNRPISLELIRNFSDIFNEECWNQISYKPNLTIEFIREFADKLNWGILYDVRKSLVTKTSEFKHYLIKVGVI